MSLSSLPPELLLHVLRFLPLQSIAAVARLSNEWHDFLREHSSMIYRNAALYHRFIDSADTSLNDAKHERTDIALDDVKEWRTYCRNIMVLEKNWTAQGTAKIRPYSSSRHHVHRIKVDAEEQIIITTHAFGGLTVTDMQTDTVLWELPPHYVREWTHCEYDKGFLIFGRLGQAEEVWCLSSRYNEDDRPLINGPDHKQLAAEHSAQSQSSSPSSRGQFKPWALIRLPEFGTASRFSYPTLAVLSETNAYLYNAVTAKTIQVIPMAPPTIWRETRYVEVDDMFVFVCTLGALKIYERGSGNLVKSISLATAQDIPSYGLDLRPFTLEKFTTQVSLRLRPIAIEGSKGPHREFRAVHVWRNHLVAMMDNAHIIIIRNYNQVISGERSLSESSVRISLLCKETRGLAKSVYLAFENGRIGVITTIGVFVITIDATEHYTPMSHCVDATEGEESVAASTPFPHVVPTILLPFRDERVLDYVSCLQMTESKLFMTYDPRRICDPSKTGETEEGGPEINSKPAEESDEDEDSDNDGSSSGSDEHRMPLRFGNEIPPGGGIPEDLALLVHAHRAHIQLRTLISETRARVGPAAPLDEVAGHDYAEIARGGNVNDGHDNDERDDDDDDDDDFHGEMPDLEDVSDSDDEESRRLSAVVCVDFGPPEEDHML